MSEFSDAFDGVGRAVSAAERFGVQPQVPPKPGVQAEGASDDGGVEVTITDGQLSRVRINQSWLGSRPVPEVERSVAAAVNQALTAYQAAAMEAYEKANVSFAELQEVVRDTQAKLVSAFRSTMQRTVDETDRQAEAGWKGGPHV